MVLGVHALPVRSDAAAPETRNTLFFSWVMLLTASATEEVGTSTIDIDLVDVEPLAHDVGADVGLVLVVGDDDLDLVMALRRLAEVLDRLARGPDASPGRTGRHRFPTGRS